MQFFVIMMHLFILIPNKEAIKLVKEKKGVSIFEFSSNKANAFQIEDGRIVVFPQQGDSSMVFKGIDDFLVFKNNPQFPEPFDDPFYRFNDRLNNMQSSLPEFIREINMRLNISIDSVNCKEDVEKIFDNLYVYCRSNDDFLEALFVPVGISIGEYLSKTYDLAWHYSTVYTFTPYKIPLLKNRKGSEFTIWSILYEFYEANAFDSNLFFQELDTYIKINRANSQQ